MPKLPFELGIGQYDEPPPDRLEEGDLKRLRGEDRFREANHLKAWIEVEDGRVVGHESSAAGGATESSPSGAETSPTGTRGGRERLGVEPHTLESQSRQGGR